MAATSDYHLCITSRHDRYEPSLEEIARLIDFLDYGFFLEGPDRNISNFVILPRRDAQFWREYQRDDPEAPIQNLNRRNVYLLHSPAAPEEPFTHYTQLQNLIDNMMPKDQPFVASLGRGTRRLIEALYYPKPGETRRWIDSQIVHLVRGPHPIWRRMWNEQEHHKEWELVAAKGFSIMVMCKVNPRVEGYEFEEYIQLLSQKEEFVTFMGKIANILNHYEFELLGGHSN